MPGGSLLDWWLSLDGLDPSCAKKYHFRESFCFGFVTSTVTCQQT